MNNSIKIEYNIYAEVLLVCEFAKCYFVLKEKEGEMKKLCVFLLCLILPILSFAMDVEVKGAIDTGYELDNGGDVASGYGLKAEFLFGETLQFGGGAGYHQFGEVDGSGDELDDETYMTAQMVYGTSKLNFGTTGFNPYIRANAGLGTADSPAYDALYDSYAELLSIDVSFDLEVGLYYAVGFGLEINNFLIEALYENLILPATLEYNGVSQTFDDFEIDILTLAFGYRFGPGN